MKYNDLHYCGILATRLDRFTVKASHPYKANFRCPLCGDSKKSKIKSRGWLLERDNQLFFYCHNCYKSLHLSGFLKQYDNNLYNQYVVDSKLNEYSPTTESFEPKPEKKADINVDSLFKLKKVSQLAWDHPVKKYLNDRKIPSESHYKLFYAPAFKKWINSILPNKFEDTSKDEPRLIIPMRGKDKKIFGIAARSFKKNATLRYITIMFNERIKVFGLDEVDFKKQYFVLEGALDSLFIENSVAMAGADLNLNALDNIENAVFVFDNEPRNKEIHQKMEQLINKGLNVVIWPADINGKDINEMILNGYPREKVEYIINHNFYSGLSGLLALKSWKRT